MKATSDSTAGRFPETAAPSAIPAQAMARLRRRRGSRSGIQVSRLTREEFVVLEALFERGAGAPCGDTERADVLVFLCASSRDAEQAEAQYLELHSRNADLIVVAPRGVEPSATETQHYAITPGSERALLYGMANILIASGWVPGDSMATHAADFEEFASLISYFTTDRVSHATGLCADELWHLAQTIADGNRVSFQWLATRARRAITPSKREQAPAE